MLPSTTPSRAPSHALLAGALVLAALWTYSCGSSKSSSFGSPGDGGASSSGGPSSGSSGSGSGSGGVVLNGGDGGTGSSSGSGTLACPSPVTANDFAQPVLDTGAPANAATLFAATDVASSGPCVYEPEMGSLFPDNWIRLRFRFTPSNGENLFEIKLVVPNETSPLVIYTTKTTYTLDAATWKAITTTGVNGPIQVTLRSAVVTNGALTKGPWTGTTGTIEVAPVAAGGSVVYWTTSNGTVLKGFQMGSEDVPQAVLTPSQASTGCIGCHTSTPDGLFVGLTASDDSSTGDTPAFVDVRAVDGGAGQLPFASASALTLLARQNQHAPAFSPGHWSAGDHIALSMFEVNGVDEIAWTNLEATSQTEGQAWGIVARNGDSNQAASASFSHDGKSIVYTSSTSVNSGTNTEDGLLYVVPYANGGGGAAAPLAGASDSGYLQYYPSYSHDDSLVAFNRIPNSLASASSPPSYNNPNAEVFVVPAGGGTATRVVANDPPACVGAPSPGVTNSWAKWSPQALSACGNTYYFFVFSSVRDPGAAGGPQLYVAPIVIDSTGKMTTYSALYPWNQPEAEHNHTPAWDQFQLPPPPTPK